MGPRASSYAKNFSASATAWSIVRSSTPSCAAPHLFCDHLAHAQVEFRRWAGAVALFEPGLLDCGIRPLPDGRTTCGIQLSRCGSMRVRRPTTWRSGPGMGWMSCCGSLCQVHRRWGRGRKPADRWCAVELTPPTLRGSRFIPGPSSFSCNDLRKAAGFTPENPVDTGSWWHLAAHGDHQRFRQSMR